MSRMERVGEKRGREGRGREGGRGREEGRRVEEEEGTGGGERGEGRGHQRQREDSAQRKATPANYRAVLALELHDC